MPSSSLCEPAFLQLARDGAVNGTVVHADQQTAGRGRLSRRWSSPPGNLYLSIVLRPEARGSDRRALADELKAHVQTRLSKHKYPRWVVFVDDLPKNDRGKVDKKLLIERERRGDLPE